MGFNPKLSRHGGIAARLARAGLLLLAATITAPRPAVSAEPAIPMHWDTRERLPQPDTAGIRRLRFLTTVDFPPFNFLDAEGQLAGFHVDLARAICRELAILDRCQIQALPFNELEKAIAERQGEAIIAGLAISERSREKFAFSHPYLEFPARFIMPGASAVSEPIHARIGGQRIGTLAGSAHERMLRAYFPNVKVVTYSRAGWMFDDLKARKIDGVFGDGMRLGFWLAGSESAGCCRFAGGPYLAPEFLGYGLAIATAKEHAELAAAIDYALKEIAVKGVFAELYLRYFPVGFY